MRLPACVVLPTGDDAHLARDSHALCSSHVRPQMFNVDTSDVLSRLATALLPFKGTSFFELIGENADLYGPAWIAATLVFVIGASANLHSWLETPSDVVCGAWPDVFVCLCRCRLFVMARC